TADNAARAESLFVRTFPISAISAISAVAFPLKRSFCFLHQRDVESRTQFSVTPTGDERGEDQMTIVATHAVGSIVRQVRARAAQIVLGAAGVVVVSLPAAALAQTSTVCGPEVKAEVAKAFASFDASTGDQLAFEKDLYAKYQFCVQDAQLVPSTFFAAARE